MLRYIAWSGILLCISLTGLSAQENRVEGVVMEELERGRLQPLEFVHVYWLGAEQGTHTDAYGHFVLDRPENAATLVVSYVGFAPDTIIIGDQRYLSIVLKGATVLDEVEVVHRRRTTEVSFLNPMLVHNVSQQELFKAACCNLSESFETTASVDVSISDAISGAREIQMLGLAGKYTMLSQEFMPGIRGLAIPYGLLYTPGAWIESMQITKGAGSVVNGYESIAGQINLELKKPQEDERLFLNAYANEADRYELNAVGAVDVSPTFQTMLLAHGSTVTKASDHNHDGFADHPVGDLLLLANRWSFNNRKGLEGQFGVKYIYDDKTAGQTGLDDDNHSHGHDPYEVSLSTKRADLWGKTGFVFPYRRYQSVGLQWSYSDHRQTSVFGLRPYRGRQQTAYVNLIFQSILGSTDHLFKAGPGFLADWYDETHELGDFIRKEIVPGAFFEYTYSSGERFSLVAGVRGDHHSIYGMKFTPRFHLRYAPEENTVLRASAGRGYRSPNVMAENLSLLASSRKIVADGDYQKGPLGMKMESAWNAGMSVLHTFTLDYRPGSISADIFYTTFGDQVVVDLDRSPQEAWLYNLEGRSYSLSMQFDAEWEVFKRLDAKAAWRIMDVRTEYRSVGLAQKPLAARHRGFLNLAYTTPRRPGGHWVFDYTVQHSGTQRIPSTASNPEGLRLRESSPPYVTMLAQVTRKVGRDLDIYLGVENLTNYRQPDAILAADDPFGEYFDSGLIWGPVFGRMFYLGVRYMRMRPVVL